MTAKKKPVSNKTAKYLLYVFDAFVVIAVVFFVGKAVSQLGGSDCSGSPAEVHTLSVKQDAFSPDQVRVAVCDKLLIQNEGAETYYLSFGTHDDLEEYPGYTPSDLTPGEQVAITAVQPGSYVLHDHKRAKAGVRITVDKD